MWEKGYTLSMTAETKLQSALEERSGEGQKEYVGSMEKSAIAKADEINPWIFDQGAVLDYGAGAGPLTDILSKRHPGRLFVPVEFSGDMVRRMESRFSGRSNIEIVQADMKNFQYEKSFGTVIAASAFHELFSFNGYDHRVVMETLKNLYENPKFLHGGRLIIRDGVQPEPETLYLKPLSQFACDRFTKFVDGFKKVRQVNFMIGNFTSDVFVQTGRREFETEDVGKSLIEISSQNASEMFSKYFYKEENLPIELTEQFGVWTLREYQKVLLNIGFTIKHADTHTLPWLIENVYSKDFEVYHLVDGVLSSVNH